MNTSLLHHFGISSAALLGKGSETQVYALDQARVLRIYPPDASLAAVQARQQFYMQLAARRPPFVIPTVLDQGVIDECPYTIEQRMRGHDFAHVLPQLTGRDRARALTSYLDLARQIGTIEFPEAPFGELIYPGTLQRDTWPRFLWDRAQRTLQCSRHDVEHDVPELDRLLDTFHARVLLMATLQTKRLVHGDYFPGNVFIDDTLTVYGIGDFGCSTVIGDARMDIAGAIVFLEVVEGYQPADTQLLLSYLDQSRVRVRGEIIELYRIYYSLYFSHCKHDDPRTYAWCIRNLRTYAIEHLLD
jgi:putative membrane protein